MMKFLIWYGVCPVIGLFIIWLKQGRYLDEIQIMPAFLFGPVLPIMALIIPSSMWTSREKREGK